MSISLEPRQERRRTALPHPTPKEVRTPPLSPSQIQSTACPACGHTPPLSHEEAHAAFSAGLRATRNLHRRFILETLDQYRPHGANAWFIRILAEHTAHLFMFEEGIEQEFHLFAAAGVLALQPPTRARPRLKARLTIGRAELATRIDQLVIGIRN
ncbi:hypothetical protein [Novosphingobium sp. EMRT-2]|uniref:hypothetical protein n=1 Tax=Novosphingobium sp. EMRT-2 TaxID=2571749 RepID=UPI0010BDDE14|nr:hypothetical protein [Novosphingobium sp. EMRT-2]QCI93446.1 hypothetical protein FA702_07650 [Novosphingobium sp. EMRT-2]